MRNSPETAAWQQHLAGAPLVKPIPTDRLPQSSRSPAPLICAVPLSEPARETLLGPDGEIRPDIAVAALSALLLRYTGETDLIIGLTEPDLLLPRVQVHGDTTLGQLRSVSRDAVVAARLLGPVPPGDLLRRPGTDGAATTVPCHALIATIPEGSDRPAGRGLRFADVVVVLERVRGRMRAGLLANAALYDRGTVNRLAKHLGGLLESLVDSAPEREVATLPLLDSAERREVLLGWNDTDDPAPPGQVHELVAAVAASTPDVPAVVDGGVTTTFAELDDAANRMANHLLACGVTAGANVGVFLPRCTESLVTQLAVFKVGATAVLLDPEYPTERLAFMLQDSSAVAVATTQKLSGTLPLEEGGRATVLVDAHAVTWRARPATDPRGPIDDESVSHIAYTSGSTGVPKAVLLRHGPLRNTIHVLRAQCGITPGSRGTWLCSPGFGLVEVDCFPVLAAGATVFIPDPAVAASPEQQRDWLIDNDIQHTLQLTAMAERLWTLPWPATAPLRSMRIAGERVRAWPAPELPFAVLNVYGSAEANVVATCDLTATSAALSDDERVARMPPIGRPVANVRTYVLDGRREPVPPGVLGELYISGESLSQGYLNRPEANVAKFLTNPLPDDPYPVLYRSGDVARYWPGGTVEIVGRIDNETKIRGYRVHLGEVESVLAMQAGVRQCAVLAREDEPGHRRLVAYVEPDPAGAPAVRDLRSELARRLPPYMLPAAYVVGDMPTTANGKIDRARLEPPPRTRPDLGTAYAPPSTPLEQRIAELLSDVLGIDEIGTGDDFFELGGDSLRAMRLLSGLRDDLGAEVPMEALFAEPTITGLARFVEAAGDGRSVPVHDAAHRHDPFPLTAAQRRHGVGVAADLYEWQRDWLDVDQFLASWAEVVARHDALRTTAGPGDGQVVGTDAPDPEVVDLQDGTDADAETAVAAGRAELRGRGGAHALRVTLLPDGSATVQLAVSPLALDADSMHRIVLPELAAAYEEPGSGTAPALTFRDVATGPLAVGTGDDVPAPASRTADAHGEPLAGLVDTPVYARFRTRCLAAGVRTETALLAAVRQVLGETGGLLPGATTPASLVWRVFDRPDTGGVEPAGFFGSVLEVGGPTEGSFTARVTGLRTGGDAADGTDALQVTVLLDGGDGTPVTTVASTAPSGAADLRIVLDEDGLRMHWTFPAAVATDPAAGALAARLVRGCVALVTRLASGQAAWSDTDQDSTTGPRTAVPAGTGGTR